MATQHSIAAEPQDGFDVEGNRLTLVVDGAARLAALLDLIDGAERDLRLLYYIFGSDALATRVRDALCAACARGVSVALLVDGFGSQDTDEGFFEPLRAAGGSVCRFLPRFGRRYLLRNHQKMALADGHRALVGGFNIDESYFAPVEAQGWRDLGLLVEGPAARHLCGYFDVVMGWAQDPRARIFALNRALKRWSQKKGQRLRWLFGGPTNRLSPWARALKADIGGARRLDMIAAYFAPNPGMLRRIGRLARRGALRVMTAARSDNSMTIAAARHTYRGLLRRGGRIFEYQPTRLHTKLFVVDDVAYVGSANFDMRSLYINCEIMLRIEDAAFASRLRALIDEEVGACREASLDLLKARAGWLTRAKWSIAYFVVAVVDYTVTRRANFGSIGAEVA